MAGAGVVMGVKQCFTEPATGIKTFKLNFALFSSFTGLKIRFFWGTDK